MPQKMKARVKKLSKTVSQIKKALKKNPALRMRLR
jgi:hypothetical protein